MPSASCRKASNTRSSDPIVPASRSNRQTTSSCIAAQTHSLPCPQVVASTKVLARPCDPTDSTPRGSLVAWLSAWPSQVGGGLTNRLPNHKYTRTKRDPRASDRDTTSGTREGAVVAASNHSSLLLVVVLDGRRGSKNGWIDRLSW